MPSESLLSPARALAAAWRAHLSASHPRQEGEKSSAKQQIEAQVAQQMLFEKWLKLDDWSLRSEAVPLLCAASPDDWPAFLEDSNHAALEQAFWNQILEQQQASGSPVPENPSDDSDQWRISSKNFYGWAKLQQLDVPSAMENLMSFIMSSVKMEMPAAPAPAAALSAADSDERVRVLGAALSLLTAVPEQCREADGWISGEKMAAQIAQKAVILFPDQPLTMSVADMATLIDHWSGLLENQEQAPF